MKMMFIPVQRMFWLCHVSGWLLATALLSLSSIDAEQGFFHSAIFSECLRFSLSLPLLLMFRYLYIQSRWQSLSVLELFSLILGFNLIAVIPVVYWVPFSISTSDAWFEQLQRESIGTSRYFDEIFVSFIYSYGLQVGWCLLYSLSKTAKINQELESDKVDIQTELEGAKLSSLSNQISPHFLFNGLNNLCSLIAIDTKKSQVVLRAFSELLRFCMEAHKHDKTSIENEVRLVDNYIAVSSIQYEDRLRFSKSISDGVCNYSVPPMMIQLLVENAIKHGVSRSKVGGDVSLTIKQSAYFIEIEVMNDGCLNLECATQSTGLGLKNILDRLLLIYGDTATCELIQKEQSVVALLRLPKEVFYERNHC